MDPSYNNYIIKFLFNNSYTLNIRDNNKYINHSIFLLFKYFNFLFERQFLHLKSNLYLI